MAILDVEQSKTTGTKGIEREIDVNAHSLIMDTIQMTQYQYPEASTVRELTSNAIDSQAEKLRAIEILTGKVNKEDYYIERQEAQYKDSNFDKEYYDLNWLDQTNNIVELKYICGSGGGWCDKLIVKDYGVGLGKKRLQGYWSIGYSTKRNTTKALGGFGFGSKASLSLRNDYYDVVTAHNGKLFKFRAYAYKVDSLVSKFKNDEGDLNNYIEWTDSKGNVSKVYYEDTTQKNFTQLEVPCKTYHRHKIKEAVDSQLLYLSGIQFTYQDEYGNKEDKKFQANILYNSKNLIISDQKTYSKPHVIIVKDVDQPTGVCYGFVNFQELEMQDLYSYVGFKCPMRQVVRDPETGKETLMQDGVEISPSRESIIWTDNTRNYLQGIITNAVKEAEDLISSQLQETNLLIWIKKAVAIKSGNNSDWTLSNISKIVDTSEINPIYSVNTDVKLKDVTQFWTAFINRQVSKEGKYVKNKGHQYFIQRQPLNNWGNFNDTIVLHEGNLYPRKDEFIIQKKSNNGKFNSIKKLSDQDLMEHLFNQGSFEHPKTTYCKSEKAFEKVKEVRDYIWDTLKADPNVIKYEELEVPEDFSTNIVDADEISVEEQGEKNIYAGMSPAEIRKLTDKIVIQHPELNRNGSSYLNSDSYIKYSKEEVVTKDFIEDKATVYYALGVEEQSLTSIAAIITSQIGDLRGGHNYRTISSKVFNSDLKIVRVPSNMGKKYLKGHRHISEFFGYKPIYSDKDTTINMNEALIKWNTCRLISKEVHELEFFTNFAQVNPDLQTIYSELENYILGYTEFNEYNSKRTVGEEEIKAFAGYMSKVTEFTLFKEANSNDLEGIKAKSTELFGVETIDDVKSIDFDIYNKYRALKEYSSQVGSLLKVIDFEKLNNEGYNVLNKILNVYGLDSFNLSDFGVNLKPDIQVVVEENNEELVELTDESF